MAINVDTVYKTVLLILNSEQRGYMTPDEFNRIGSQVQRQIFEAYFEDLNQQLRVPQSDMEYSDRVAITDEKIAEFKVESNATHTAGGIFTLPSDLYRLGSLTFEDTGKFPVEIQRVGRADFYNIRKSPLTAPTKTQPIYLYEDNKVLVYPTDIASKVKAQYVKKPTDIRWGYVLGALNQYVFTDYVYDPTSINIGDQLNITSNYTSGATDGIYPQAAYTGGSGTNAQFNVTISGGVASGVEVASQGSGYVAGDTITFTNSTFGSPVGGPFQVQISQNNLFAQSQQGYKDFDLHNSERTEVILRILLYAGVVIRDPQIIQVAAQKVQQEEVNEKS
tara:strand:- start:19638 stop:20642 length:1005 start_codon:yes stop_codon:yes gene_type:complete